MRDLVGDESVSLDGPNLRLSVVSAEGFVTAEIRQAGGDVSLVAPVLKISGPQAAAFDLRRIAVRGEFELLLRTAAGEAVRFGAQSARNLRLLGQRRTRDAPTEIRRKLVQSSYRQGENDCHALVYADTAQGLRLRTSATDDIAAFLAEAAPRTETKKAGRREARRKFSVVTAVQEAGDTLEDHDLAWF